MLMVGVRLVRRKSTGVLKRVIDEGERLHRGEFLGRDVTSRPLWSSNDGQHYRQELENGWVYALRGRNI